MDHGQQRAAPSQMELEQQPVCGYTGGSCTGQDWHCSSHTLVSCTEDPTPGRLKQGQA